MAVFGEEQREEGIAGVAQRASDEVRHRVDAGIEGTKKLVDGASGAQPDKHPKESSGSRRPEEVQQAAREARAAHWSCLAAGQ